MKLQHHTRAELLAYLGPHFNRESDERLRAFAALRHDLSKVPIPPARLVTSAARQAPSSGKPPPAAKTAELKPKLSPQEAHAQAVATCERAIRVANETGDARLLTEATELLRDVLADAPPAPGHDRAALAARMGIVATPPDVARFDPTSRKLVLAPALPSVSLERRHDREALARRMGTPSAPVRRNF